MKHFTKSVKALRGLMDVILGGSGNVVRTIKQEGHMGESSVKHV